MKDFYIHHLEKKVINDMTEYHVHKGYEFYYQILGNRNYDIDYSRFPVQKGDFVFIHPNVPHLTTSSNEVFYERIVVNMNMHFLKEWESRFSDFALFHQTYPYIKFSFQAERKYVTHLIYNLLEEYRSQDENRQLRIQALLIELFILLERQISAPQKPNDTSENSNWLISNVCEYIQEHYDTPLTLQGLAEHFYISPYTLSRKFNACTSLSVPQYINLIRIDNIKEIFREDTTSSLTDIITRQGFNSLSHFNKVFKQLEHISPTEYRNQFLNQT